MKPCRSCKSDLADNAQACPVCGHFYGSAVDLAAKVFIFLCIAGVLVGILVALLHG